MDTVKAFKHSPELREYWRLVKRKQRARPIVSKEVKTEQNERFGGKQSVMFEDFKDKVREHSQNEPKPLSASLSPADS